MKIKAVGFDVGQTLIKYNNPLNWKSLYRPALQNVMNAYQITETEERMGKAIEILTKYNTRENHREYEVNSNNIFTEILTAWNMKTCDVSRAKDVFYNYFRAEAVCFLDTNETLEQLSGMGLKIGFLTDVAYGMDNKYAFEDISSIKLFFDVCLSSNDIGFRKPHECGFRIMIQKFGVSPHEMLYVGDEEKDIIGANNVGAISALINRTSQQKEYGQQYTISSLNEILNVVINHR